MNEALPAVVAEYFDAAFYLGTYRDVAEAEADPLRHWLAFGCKEGRQISGVASVRYGDDAVRSKDRGWAHFRRHGQDIAVKTFGPLPQQVAAQIANQARHDPAMLAARGAAIGKLSLFDREDVRLDVVSLRRAFPSAPDYLFIVPDPAARGALAGGLLAALRDLGSVRTIVTDQSRPAGAESNNGAKPLDLTGPVYWRDYWITGPEDLKIVQLAQLIRLLRPRAAIVAGSPHGYEAVARFGRALAERSALYCVYTGDAEGRALMARYAQRTLPRAVTLTDSGDLAARLRGECDAAPEPQIVALPQGDRAGLARQVAVLLGSA